MGILKFVFNPIIKAIASVIFVFISGVLCSALVAELRVLDGNLQWREMTSKVSFYLILFVILLAIAYNILSAKNEIRFKGEYKKNLMQQLLINGGEMELAFQFSEALRNNDIERLRTTLGIVELIDQNLG